MSYEVIKSKVEKADKAIFEHLDKEIEVIKADYLSELNNNYEEEQDGCESFEEYLEENANEYVDFAFDVYLAILLTQLCDVTTTELEALSADEKDLLFKPYSDYFKEKSGLGYGYDPDLM